MTVEQIKKLVVALPGALMGVFLSMTLALQALLILQLLDFATGFLVAWSSGAVSSDISRKGFVKKCVALLLVVAIHAFVSAQPIGFDLASMTATWFCATELISIAENAGRAGWRLPKFLVDALAKIQSNSEDKPK
jgi:toxin secretion/phage lysis holin